MTNVTMENHPLSSVNFPIQHGGSFQFVMLVITRGEASRLFVGTLWSRILEGIFQIPSGYVKIAIENGPFIVDCPIKNGDFP